MRAFFQSRSDCFTKYLPFFCSSQLKNTAVKPPPCSWRTNVGKVHQPRHRIHVLPWSRQSLNRNLPTKVSMAHFHYGSLGGLYFYLHENPWKTYKNHVDIQSSHDSGKGLNYHYYFRFQIGMFRVYVTSADKYLKISSLSKHKPLQMVQGVHFFKAWRHYLKMGSRDWFPKLQTNNRWK